MPAWAAAKQRVRKPRSRLWKNRRESEAIQAGIHWAIMERLLGLRKRQPVLDFIPARINRPR